MGFFGDITGGGLFNAGTSLLNSWLDRRQSMENTERTNQANLKLAQYSFDQQKQMWNQANAYNTPAAQMQRFKDAGLNPNLIYGQGSSGNTPNVLPQYHAPNVDYNYKPLQLPYVLSQYQDFALKKAQINNVEANTKNTDQRTANEAVTNAILLNRKYAGSLELDKTMIEKPYWGKMARSAAELRQNQADYYWSSSNLKDYQGEYQRYQNKAAERLINLAIENADAQVKNTIAKTTAENIQNVILEKRRKWFTFDKVLETMLNMSPMNSLTRMLGTGSQFLK